MSYKKEIVTAVLAVSLALTACSGQTNYQRQVYKQQPTTGTQTKYVTPTPNPSWDGTKQQCNAVGGKYIQGRCVITGPGVDIYQVKKGDTLWDIAVSYGIKDWSKFLDEFNLLNPNVDPNNLQDGQRILIPYKQYE